MRLLAECRVPVILEPNRFNNGQSIRRYPIDTEAPKKSPEYRLETADNLYVGDSSRGALQAEMIAVDRGETNGTY